MAQSACYPGQAVDARDSGPVSCAFAASRAACSRESFGVAVAVRAGMDANHPAIRHYTAVPVPGHNPGTDMVAAGLVSLRPHALQPVTGRQITT